MAFELRRAVEADLAAVGEVTVEGYLADGFLDAEDDYVEHLRDARHRYESAELWVAVVAGEVVGSTTFCPAGSSLQEVARENEGEFRMLAVAAAARRRGIAEALVSRCVERSRELGYDAVVLCSMREMTTAHRLYERLGFVRLPERDWSPVAGVDLLAFRLPLAGSPGT